MRLKESLGDRQVRAMLSRCAHVGRLAFFLLRRMRPRPIRRLQHKVPRRRGGWRVLMESHETNHQAISPGGLRNSGNRGANAILKPLPIRTYFRAAVWISLISVRSYGSDG